MTTDTHALQIQLYREVLNKYRPSGELESKLVYQIFALHWANSRLHEFYVASSQKREFAANTATLFKLEQRLALLQAAWPQREQSGPRKRKDVLEPAVQ
ncbi:MAG: hypothetical protein JNM66_02180 [Bryobacterales bacterium]|nr:hypothetical protein [Bryobacterales bacterium]